jgi:hypothetical protein
MVQNNNIPLLWAGCCEYLVKKNINFSASQALVLEPVEHFRF